MYNWIFGLLLLAILLLYIGIGIRRGKRYLWVYSGLRLGAVIEAAISAMVLSVLIARTVAAFAYPFLLDAPFLASVAPLIRALPSATGVFRALVSILLAPLLFAGLYKLLRRAWYCAARYGARELVRQGRVRHESITVCEEEPTTKKNTAKRRDDDLRVEGKNPWGMVLGGLCGLALCVVMLTPILGLISLTDAAVKMTALQADEPPTGVVVQITDGAANNPTAKGIGFLGAKALYSGMTTGHAGEHRIRLVKEIEFFSAAGTAVLQTTDSSVSPEEAADRVRATARAFSDTSLLPILLPELCAAAEESWSAGEEFCGIGKPTLGNNTNGLTDSVLALLSESDYDTIKTDMDTALELTAILVERGGFSRMVSDPAALLGERETVSLLLYEMLRNPHTRPYVGTLSRYGMRLMGDALSMRYDRDALYEEFLAEGVTVIEDARVDGTLDTERLSADYGALLDRYGLFLIDRSREALIESTAQYYERRTAVAADYGQFLSQQTLVLKGGVLISLEDTLRMRQASSLVGLSELHFDSDRVEPHEAEQEANTLAEALGAAMELCDTADEGGAISATLCGMGPILDALSATQTVGEDETDGLLMCMLQSEELCDRVGLTVSEASELADTVSEKARAVGYTRVMNAMGHAIRVIRDASSGTDTEPAMEALMRELNRDVAQVLRVMASPRVLQANGVAQTGAKEAAALFADLMEDLAEAKAGGIGDGEYREELYGAMDLINLALCPGDALFGEGGRLGVSAEEYVARMLAAQVVCRTMVNTAYPDGGQTPAKNPLGSEKTPSAEEEAELLAAMNQAWSSSTKEQQADSNYRKTYLAMGAMMNLELALDSAGITKVPSVPENGEQSDGVAE